MSKVTTLTGLKFALRPRHPRVLLFVGLIVLAVCMWAWYFLHNPNQFPVKSVKVTGEYQHVSEEKIKQIVKPLVSHGIFTSNLRSIQRELMQLPWVKHAIVERVWPSEIKITLTERKPLAVWNRQSLISKQANVFSPDPKSFPKNLPQLIGPKGQQPIMLTAYEHISEIIAPLGLHIDKLQLTSNMLWRMQLNTGLDVMIGGDNIIQRSERFAQIYNNLFAHSHRRAKSVDLRYVDGVAVKWA